MMAIGTTFFVMEYVDGRLFDDVTLPGLSPQERRTIYFEMIRVLAELHSVDYVALGRADFGKHGALWVLRVRAKRYREENWRAR
jgi:aminoglycoside phosphotransferase (APT) family kinase protein